MIYRSRGLSLVEVMVSIFILFIGVLALIGIFPNMARSARSGINTTVALNAAQTKMDRVLDPTSPLPAPPFTETETSAQIAGLNNLNGATCVTTYAVDPGGNASLRLITVTVNWNENTQVIVEGRRNTGSRNRSLTMTSMAVLP